MLLGQMGFCPYTFCLRAYQVRNSSCDRNRSQTPFLANILNAPLNERYIIVIAFPVYVNFPVTPVRYCGYRMGTYSIDFFSFPETSLFHKYSRLPEYVTNLTGLFGADVTHASETDFENFSGGNEMYGNPVS